MYICQVDGNKTPNVCWFRNEATVSKHIRHNNIIIWWYGVERICVSLFCFFSDPLRPQIWLMHLLVNKGFLYFFRFCPIIYCNAHVNMSSLCIQPSYLYSQWPWYGGDWLHIKSERSRCHYNWVAALQSYCIFLQLCFYVTIGLVK